MIPVNIKEKACQRVFKRGIAKVEVLSKGGFLRGDTLLGTASGKKNLFHTFLLLSVCRI
jgi:coiled-coil and C2 domain-containing protein 1